MKHPTNLLMLLVCLAAFQLNAQSNLLQSGPMVGYSEMTEVLLWVQTTEAANVYFEYHPLDEPGKTQRSATVKTKPGTAFVAKVLVTGLTPGTQYAYSLFINERNVTLEYPLQFQSQALWQWRTDPPAFKIALASCFYVNETEYDRPGTPYGGEFEILDALHRQAPDAMLWLGDNTYLREADWYSWSGILHRHTHTRSLSKLQPLLGSIHHYAIWDDHDYGPNNSDRSFRGKDQALKAFSLFWGNPSAGIDRRPGVTTMFQWADVDFFLLDNRYYRTPNYRKSGYATMLGEHQIEWLIDALVTSPAPFKVIAMGGQVLNPAVNNENYSRYAQERDHLLNLIAEEGITGVIFVSGDRHHSELTVLPRTDGYALHEITISPLTAGPAARNESEANTLRQPGTFVGKRNFGILSFSGPREDRRLQVDVHGVDGEVLWTRQISASDLK